MRERGAVLRPVYEVAGRRDGQPRNVAIPLRVGEHISGVVRLDDAGILDAPGPLEARLRVPVGVEDRCGATREVQCVRAFRQADARRVPADAHLAARVFGAVQQVHLAVVRDGKVYLLYRTTAAGLKVAYASHSTVLSLIGE